METKPIPRVCGNCVSLITEEGEPYYCARQDLYTFRKLNSRACRDFVIPKEMKDNGNKYNIQF